MLPQMMISSQLARAAGFCPGVLPMIWSKPASLALAQIVRVRAVAPRRLKKASPQPYWIRCSVPA